jgi:hypothetical protein
MESENIILKKIAEQLEIVGREHETAKNDLLALVESFISDISANMKKYVMSNVRRETRKAPDAAAGLDDAQIDTLRLELESSLEPEIERVLSLLRDNPEWMDDDTSFLDINSKAWKAVKSIEPPVNATLGKYGLNPINLKNWTWLSAEIDALITTGFPGAKKEFVDKSKQLRYLQSRFHEESRMKDVLGRLDSL